MTSTKIRHVIPCNWIASDKDINVSHSHAPLDKSMAGDTFKPKRIVLTKAKQQSQYWIGLKLDISVIGEKKPDYSSVMPAVSQTAKQLWAGGSFRVKQHMDIVSHGCLRFTAMLWRPCDKMGRD